MLIYIFTPIFTVHKHGALIPKQQTWWGQSRLSSCDGKRVCCHLLPHGQDVTSHLLWKGLLGSYLLSGKPLNFNLWKKIFLSSRLTSRSFATVFACSDNSESYRSFGAFWRYFWLISSNVLSHLAMSYCLRDNLFWGGHYISIQFHLIFSVKFIFKLLVASYFCIIFNCEWQFYSF